MATSGGLKFTTITGLAPGATSHRHWNNASSRRGGGVGRDHQDELPGPRQPVRARAALVGEEHRIDGGRCRGLGLLVERLTRPTGRPSSSSSPRCSRERPPAPSGTTRSATSTTSTPGRTWLRVLVGAMVERVMGASWEALMDTHAFSPLGMTTVGYGPPAAPTMSKTRTATATPPDHGWRRRVAGRLGQVHPPAPGRHPGIDHAHPGDADPAPHRARDDTHLARAPRLGLDHVRHRPHRRPRS